MIRISTTVFLFFFVLIVASKVNGQEFSAGDARVDLFVVNGEILNPRLAPLLGAAHRMDWVEPGGINRTAWATIPIHEFSESQFEFRFSVSENATVQIDFKGPWEENEAGNIKQLMVQWVSVKSSTGNVRGFQTGEAWHDRPITCQLEAKAGEEISLKCVAAVPERFRDTASARPAIDSAAFELAKQFQRGVNLANFLEVPPGEDWGDNTIREEDFRQIADEGFDHVRVPVGWHHYVGPGPEYQISKQLMDRVVSVLDQAQAVGLGAIVNVHHFNEFNHDPEGQRQKLIRIWEQVATMICDRPPNVALEIINEPNDRVTTEFMNDFYAEVIPAIRRIDPTHAIIVGPGNFNLIHDLGKLKLPPDDRLIITFHSYTPHFFTHQSADWAGETKSIRGVLFPGPPEHPIQVPALLPQYLKDQLEQYNRAPADENPCSVAAIAAEMKLAANWGRFWHRPVFLGEFGAYVEVDQPSRARYCEAVRRECERQGIGWCIWDWKATFNYWDRTNQKPLPGMHEALFGE